MSRIVAFRVHDGIYAKWEEKAQAKGMSVSEWVRWVLSIPYHPEAKLRAESQGMTLEEWIVAHIKL